ncbi:unnamed protein product [Vitrella brassicaformis CCMP3155]|uniref:N-acetyltransferase domain-containing protein n=2 Tax=Vitrella brassicaformis TaxID=1169539 RepID=A0A0G4EQP0_VITBC|nr:unnamed protein product [Vitrella brassicaformis CCMP3155]|eukprot:CEL99951.1 unnamed protein product [Vitrella brassicaformis CCMP3155]
MPSSSVSIRLGVEEDIPKAASICCDAFNTLCASVALPPEFNSPADIEHFFHSLMKSDSKAFFVAVDDESGELVGGNGVEHVDESVASIGPVFVLPGLQKNGVGRALMETVIDWANSRGAPSIRLQQLASNVQSFSLYTRMGFICRKQCLHLRGWCLSSSAPSPSALSPAYTLRQATGDDAGEAAELYHRVTGERRDNQIREAFEHQMEGHPAKAYVLTDKGSGKMVAYTGQLYFFTHSCALTEDHFVELVTRVCDEWAKEMPPRENDHLIPPTAGPPSFLLPVDYPKLARTLLDRGMRTVSLTNLMSIGEWRDGDLAAYNGVYVPSVGY